VFGANWNSARTEDLFCTTDTCPAVIGNVLVYRDVAAHVTATYAGTVSSYLVERIIAASR